MVKCLSKFCDHDNPEGAIRCSKCGLDLTLPVVEVEGRDKIYGFFKALVPELKKEKKFKEFADFMEKVEVGVFHSCIERYVGFLFTLALGAGKKIGGSKTTEKEMTLLDIEKEKLKILKEIRNELKNKKQLE